jgi:NAD(P)-dependent dehydrogenase (short-subunit alcohol dehydrogenase family)
MKKILLFGGTGGIGTKIQEILGEKYECVSIGSKICNVVNEESVKEYLNENTFDIIIYLSVKNIDGLIHKQSNESVNEQLNVNLIGFLNVLRYATSKMRNNNFGRVIYISSILAKKPMRGAGIYSASKSFCESLIKTYSLENGKYNITANNIQLGYFNEGLINKLPSEILQSVLDKITIKRLGNVSELCNVIETIINTEYLNGTTISINGGYENE